MRIVTWLIILLVLCFSLAGCDEGDPSALKQAVKAADLEISSISVEPADGVITTGYSYQFTAIGHRVDGSTIDITDDVVWSTSNNTIATVNTSGRVTTAMDGSVTISANLASLSGNTSLTSSSEPLLSIAIYADTDTPDDLSVSACRNLSLKAIGTYADGVRDIIPITEYVTWSIANGSGDIGEHGLLSTSSDGIIGVQASLGIDSPVTDVTAIADLMSISISPMNSTVRLNTTLQYTASGTYVDNSTADISDNVVWSSADDIVADFNDPDTKGGLITALTEGGTTVTAACGGVVSASAGLTVSDEALDYLRFEDPDSNEIETYSMVVGEVSRITLRAYYTSGADSDVTEDAQWSLLDGSPAGIITVSDDDGSEGRITALAAGQANVKVVYQQREKVLPVTVTIP